MYCYHLHHNRYCWYYHRRSKRLMIQRRVRSQRYPMVVVGGRNRQRRRVRIRIGMRWCGCHRID